MPGSDYNYVELFRELHLNRIWPSQCLGGTELEFNPSPILQGNFAQTHWVILLQTRASPVYIFAVPRETTLDPRQEILRTSARLFQQQGYDATSMNDVAAALRLSKGGLYHHFQSKEEILFNLMNHAMDITEERVLKPAKAVPDPVERLRTLIRLHIAVVLSERDREITVMLHENHPLSPMLRKRINMRKKDYIHFVENLVAEVHRLRGSKGTVTPRAAAFALLGMINWIYQWYRPEGALQEDALVQQYTEIFFQGALG